jgi:hypothetical protein
VKVWFYVSACKGIAVTVLADEAVHLCLLEKCNSL